MVNLPSDSYKKRIKPNVDASGIKHHENHPINLCLQDYNILGKFLNKITSEKEYTTPDSQQILTVAQRVGLQIN